MDRKTGLVLLIIGAVVGVLLAATILKGRGIFGGSAALEPAVASSTVTASQINCSATNIVTQVVVAGSQFSFFLAALDGKNKAYLCAGNDALSRCSATSGIPLFASSSVFSQDFGYGGPYSCKGVDATTTLNVMYAR